MPNTPAAPPAPQDSPARRVIVAGIGASAGGIEALQAFFEALPEDVEVAFVVVVHLSPEHRSELSSVLAYKTQLPIEEVSGTVPLQAGHIYVIPPDRRLEMTDTHVGAFPFDEPRGQRAPIDTFFRSLAKEHGDGFGVILSGGGSDGAVGVKAIKEAGGIVLVQDPKESAFDAMPRASIATGVADLVLPVRELARRLSELTRSKQRLQEIIPALPAKPADDTSEAVIGRILVYLHARTGHDFSHYKRATVLRRIIRRMQVQGRENLDDYLSFLRQNAEEAQALFNDMLISVTTFFRDPDAFDALQQRVIPALFENQEARSDLRVWVPGCATGEEAYSIAILLFEEAVRRDVWPELQVFATDLDEGALATAREGRYPEAISADISEERLARFFRREDHHYCVTKDLRECVLFATHSLLKDPPFARLDLVSCRNLLIYLDRELQQQVFAILHYALRPGGYLFLGSSESAEGKYFQSLDKQHHLFQPHDMPGETPLPMPEILFKAPRIRPPVESEQIPQLPPAVTTHRTLLEHLGPPSILVNDHYQVLNLSESAGRYLQPPAGPITQNITALVRTELRISLQEALDRTFHQNKTSSSAFVPVAFNGTPRLVAVMVSPRPPARGQARLALVVFLESDEAQTGSAAGSEDGPHPQQAELQQTREQLSIMREQYESANEELRAANEEYQSVNEEYRSTAEELETSKEELQSINEELQTVNNDLKNKLDEISRAHNDLENLMTATEIATLFLDRDLCIHRFTTPLAAIFNIKTSDRGRPIGDLTHHLDYTELEADARQVLSRLVPIEREQRSRQGQWYLLRLRPYRTVDDHIDGVVITFIDITERKTGELALTESREQLAQELTVIRRLHQMALQVVAADTTQAALDEIMQAALDLLEADFGNIQLFDESSKTLKIVAQRHLPGEFLDIFKKVSAEEDSACGRALRSRERILIEDVRTDQGYKPFWSIAATTGYRAVQTTPLLNRQGDFIGALSTHWTEPHTLSDRDARLLDLLTQQASGLISRLRSEEALQINAAQLQQQAEELRSHDQHKNEFLGLLSHELRNPLTAMMSSLQALTVMQEDDERRAPLLAMLENQCQHMAHLVGDLLDISRINSGKVQLRRQPLQLQDIITTTVAAIQPQIDSRQHRLTLDLPPQTIWLNADPARLRQILSNLLSNAAKYTDPGGRLDLNVRRDSDDEVLIIIRDNGIGISTEELPHIFEPFTQVQQPRNRLQDGLGLGLALVHELVELHDGTVSAHSDGPGQGCEIRLQLPVLKETPPPGQDIIRTDVSTPVTPRRILLIDDNVSITTALEVLLQMNGHEVQTVNNSPDALEVALEFRPDVALIDIAMPELDGLQVARQLRTGLADQAITLIAVTGYGAEEDVNQIRAAGFDVHLLKPVQLAELQAAIDSVAEKPAAD